MRRTGVIPVLLSYSVHANSVRLRSGRWSSPQGSGVLRVPTVMFPWPRQRPSSPSRSPRAAATPGREEAPWQPRLTRRQGGREQAAAHRLEPGRLCARGPTRPLQGRHRRPVTVAKLTTNEACTSVQRSPDHSKARPLGRRWHRLDSPSGRPTRKFALPVELADPPDSLVGRADGAREPTSPRLARLRRRGIDAQGHRCAPTRIPHRYVASKWPLHDEGGIPGGVMVLRSVPTMKVHEREEPQPTHGWGLSRRCVSVSRWSCPRRKPLVHAPADRTLSRSPWIRAD